MKDVIHRLTTDQVKLWLISPVAQKMMSSKLQQVYGRRDVRICSPTMYWLAYLKSSGEIIACPPPHTQYKPWQIANQPSPAECGCAGFYDEESGEEWGARNSGRHHPVCQYSPTGEVVFRRAERSRSRGEARRPDQLLQLESEERARGGLDDGKAPAVVGGGRQYDKSRH